MKGISYHLLIHGPDRIQTPLVRDGERGLGEVPRGDVGGGPRPHRRRAQAHRRRVGLGHRPRVQPGARLRLHPEGRGLPRLRRARHDARHELRLQRRPAHGHADHVRRAERRARVQGLGQQPLHPADRRQSARDAHPRRALHPRRRGRRRPPRRRRPDLLVHGVQGRRLAADQARHRRGARPRPVPPGDRGRRRRLGLHAHVHRRAAAGARGHRQAPARARAGGRAGARPRPGGRRGPGRVRRRGAAGRARPPRCRRARRPTACRRSRRTATWPGTPPAAAPWSSAPTVSACRRAPTSRSTASTR